MLRIRLTFCALLLTAGTAAAAVQNAGTTAGNFLSVGTGAATLAMGGAVLGWGGDLAASAWNPAALASAGTSQFALSHAALASQSSQDWLAASGILGHGRARWSTSVLYQDDGTIQGLDSFGQPIGTFSISHIAAGGRVACPLGNHVQVGGGVNWITEQLGDVSGSGLGLDAGMQIRYANFGLGGAARNLGGQMKFPTGRYDLPAVMGVGASWFHPRSGLGFAVDANYPKAYLSDIRMGAQWLWHQRLALRAGYRMEQGATTGETLSGPSFGFGAGANGLWFDYAFLAGNADAQGQHRVSLSFRPGFFGRRTLAAGADSAGGAPSAQLAANTPAPTRPARSPKPPKEPKAAKPVKSNGSAAPSFESAVATALVAGAKPGTGPVKPSAFVPAPAPAAEAAVPTDESARARVKLKLPEHALASEVLPRAAQPHARVLAASLPVSVPALLMPRRAAPAAKVAPAPAPAPAPAVAAVPEPDAGQVSIADLALSAPGTIVPSAPAPAESAATPVEHAASTAAPIAATSVASVSAAVSDAPVPAPATQVASPAPETARPAPVAAEIPAASEPPAATQAASAAPTADSAPAPPAKAAPAAPKPAPVAQAPAVEAKPAPLADAKPAATAAPVADAKPTPAPVADAKPAPAPVADANPTPAPVADAQPAAPAPVAQAQPEDAKPAPVAEVKPVAPKPAATVATFETRPVATPNRADTGTPSGRPTNARAASSHPSVQVVVIHSSEPLGAQSGPVMPHPDSVVLKKGQTLADVAKQWGFTTAALMMENNIVTDNPKQGTRIKLPKK